MLRIKRVIQFAQIYLLICVIIYMVVAAIPFERIVKADVLVMATFLFNGILWFCLLISEVRKRPFSFLMIHWSFCLLFFFFAAVVQYLYEHFPWVGNLDDEDLLFANMILLLWTVGVVLGSSISKLWRKKRIRIVVGENKSSSLPIFYDKGIKDINEGILYALTLANLLIAIFRVRNIGVMNLLARATSSIVYADNSSLSTLIAHSLEAVSYFTVIVAVLYYKRKSRKLGLVVVNIMCLLLAYFPTGLARYAAASIYLGVAITIFDGLKKGRLFPLLFLAGFIVVLPLLNAFRNMSFENVSLVAQLQKIMSNAFTEWLEGDYDAYTLLVLTIKHVQTNGIAYGYQFLGVLLFWVPRSFWPDKPIGSGHTVATALGWEFTNLSCPLPAEGYINGGIVGTILLSLFIGWLFRKIDICYWKKRRGDCDEVKLLDILYPVLSIYIFFVSRGDLLSSFAYVMAYTVVGCLIYKVLTIKIGLRKK